MLLKRFYDFNEGCVSLNENNSMQISEIYQLNVRKSLWGRESIVETLINQAGYVFYISHEIKQVWNHQIQFK